MDFQVHFDALKQFIEMAEGQLVLMNHGLEFAVNRKLRRLGSASAAYVRTPGGEVFAPTAAHSSGLIRTRVLFGSEFCRYAGGSLGVMTVMTPPARLSKINRPNHGEQNDQNKRGKNQKPLTRSRFHFPPSGDYIF